METFSALLAICAGNSPAPGEFPAQRPVTRSFRVFFDLRLNKPLSKQSWGWWFETLPRPLWRHCNGNYSMTKHNKTEGVVHGIHCGFHGRGITSQMNGNSTVTPLVTVLKTNMNKTSKFKITDPLLVESKDHRWIAFTNVTVMRKAFPSWRHHAMSTGRRRSLTLIIVFTMTSSDGSIFRVAGPLWGKPPVISGFPSQRPVPRSFDIFFAPEQTVEKQSRGRWFETSSLSSWRHIDHCYSKSTYFWLFSFRYP